MKKTVLLLLLALLLAQQAFATESQTWTYINITATTTTTTTTVPPAGVTGGGGIGPTEPRFVFDVEIRDKMYSVNSLVFNMTLINKGDKSGDIRLKYDILWALQPKPILSRIEQFWVNATSEYLKIVGLDMSDICRKPATLNVTIWDVETPEIRYAMASETICIELRECLSDNDCPTNEMCVNYKCFHKPPDKAVITFPIYLLFPIAGIILLVVIFIYDRRPKKPQGSITKG